jgi:hypothetical protein
MKKLLITIGILISLSFSQLDFETIWSKGYEDGYCYDVEFCIKPLPKIAPLPRLKDTTYKIIYNRGFLTGLKAQK